MENWTIVYYETADGRSVVEEEIERFSPKAQAKVIRWIDMMEEEGPDLGADYTRHVRGPIWELRVSFGKDEHRVLYFAHFGRTLVMLLAFKKKTKKTPQNMIRLAFSRMLDFIEAEKAEATR